MQWVSTVTDKKLSGPSRGNYLVGVEVMLLILMVVELGVEVVVLIVMEVEVVVLIVEGDLCGPLGLCHGSEAQAGMGEASLLPEGESPSWVTVKLYPHAGGSGGLCLVIRKHRISPRDAETSGEPCLIRGVWDVFEGIRGYFRALGTDGGLRGESCSSSTSVWIWVLPAGALIFQT
ncbi:unnamed protein product [Gadus morhua 'NCC']